MPLSVVIIDDELDGRTLLKGMLENYVEGMKVVGMAENAKEGVALINELKPDAVFLDVQMPGESGFYVLDQFEAPYFKTVFVTANEQHAVQAIKYSAFDYILKPVPLSEIRSTVERLKVSHVPVKEQFTLFQKNINQQEEAPKMLALPDKTQMRVVKLDDIAQVTSKDGLSIFKLVDNDSLISSYPLGYYEDLLPAEDFFRAHRSCIIHRSAIHSYDTGRGGKLYLKSGDEVTLSVRRKTGFLDWIKQR
jgi:two-component system LytT family response regulator